MKKSKAVLFFFLVVVNFTLVYFFKIKTTFQQVLIIHIFLFSLAVLSELIKTKLSKRKNTTPSHLLSINFLRIIACIIFLLPIILNHEKPNNTYIYNFFICYFLYLFCDPILKSKKRNKIKI